MFFLFFFNVYVPILITYLRLALISSIGMVSLSSVVFYVSYVS
jgi:hypothetical protein